MKNGNNQSKNTVDELIGTQLQEQQSKFSLSNDFNRSLMAKIAGLEEQRELPKVYSLNSFVLPIALFVILSLLTFVYMVGAESLEVFASRYLAIDGSIFATSGMKYMLYSLMALFVFSLLDRVLQIKIHSAVK